MAFWDDLNPINSNSSDGMAGQVSFYSDSSKLVVWYNDVVHWGDDNPYNFQIIIHNTGLIDINYDNMDGDIQSATIGIQNEYGQIGHQVIYNSNYIEDNLRLSFKQANEWINIDTQNYINNSITNEETAIHNIQIDGYLLSDDEYYTYIHLMSNATAPMIIPLFVQVGYNSMIGDVNQDNLINVQDVVLLINMIVGNVDANNEADINQDNQLNILDAVLLITLILET